ncbi:hypothetical protein BP6252_00496 [Coleophoma cylindrospora]|uniref:Phosphatidic acid phosphatase type 2/haloperoxidase domain-containing protein n=1 Tax=Coleophoma cylindrospora TaxID=1849047 RepID=A0A3D8SQJ2_9HELO|nr:hypothetical protein BP6252_00496 [Coleophoma cylindrospora]
MGAVSVALIASYVTDWIIIVVAAGLAALFYTLTPTHRPFSLADPSISFPNLPDTISTATLALTGFIAPAAIIFVVTLLLVPGPTVPKSTPKALIWRRKLWELHTGWLGLAVSLASALFLTFGMKNLFGKPRPDMLARCIPDLTKIAEFTVGGYTNVTQGVPLVSYQICQSTDKTDLSDAFSSFPSGHSSFSSAGLVYLTVFLASKLAVTLPFLAPTAYNAASHMAFPPRNAGRSGGFSSQTAYNPKQSAVEGSGHDDKLIAARNQAAAPPLYLLVLVLVPLFTSIYISATRWSDYKHHGFDILFGFAIGTTSSLFAFRYYHLPINQGAGWSWGPRSGDRAFWAGIGVGSYVGEKAGEAEERPFIQRNDDMDIPMHHLRADSGAQDNIELLSTHSPQAQRERYGRM